MSVCSTMIRRLGSKLTFQRLHCAQNKLYKPTVLVVLEDTGK